MDDLHAASVYQMLQRVPQRVLALVRKGFVHVADDAATRYDLLIKGGHIIDSRQGLSDICDIAILGHRIAQLAPDIPAALAHQVIDARGNVVTPGLIDVHVHVYDGVAPLGIPADPNCIAKGVTTALDAGSAGAHTFPGLLKSVINVVDTRGVITLSTSRWLGSQWTPGITSMENYSNYAAPTRNLRFKPLRSIETRSSVSRSGFLVALPVSMTSPAAGVFAEKGCRCGCVHLRRSPGASCTQQPGGSLASARHTTPKPFRHCLPWAKVSARTPSTPKNPSHAPAGKGRGRTGSQRRKVCFFLLGRCTLASLPFRLRWSFLPLSQLPTSQQLAPSHSLLATRAPRKSQSPSNGESQPRSHSPRWCTG